MASPNTRPCGEPPGKPKKYSRSLDNGDASPRRAQSGWMPVNYAMYGVAPSKEGIVDRIKAGQAKERHEFKPHGWRCGVDGCDCKKFWPEAKAKEKTECKQEIAGSPSKSPHPRAWVLFGGCIQLLVDGIGYYKNTPASPWVNAGPRNPCKHKTELSIEEAYEYNEDRKRQMEGVVKTDGWPRYCIVKGGSYACVYGDEDLARSRIFYKNSTLCVGNSANSWAPQMEYSLQCDTKEFYAWLRANGRKAAADEMENVAETVCGAVKVCVGPNAYMECQTVHQIKRHSWVKNDSNGWLVECDQNDPHRLGQVM